MNKMNKMNKMNALQKGWTLVELGIVLVIISIAAGFVLSGSDGLQDGPKMSSMRDVHMSTMDLKHM